MLIQKAMRQNHACFIVQVDECGLNSESRVTDAKSNMWNCVKFIDLYCFPCVSGVPIADPKFPRFWVSQAWATLRLNFFWPYINSHQIIIFLSMVSLF